MFLVLYRGMLGRDQPHLVLPVKGLVAQTKPSPKRVAPVRCRSNMKPSQIITFKNTTRRPLPSQTTGLLIQEALQKQIFGKGVRFQKHENTLCQSSIQREDIDPL
jgi:hypothetical protein